MEVVALLCRNASTTGAILMASGRVPKMDKIRKLINTGHYLLLGMASCGNKNDGR